MYSKYTNLLVHIITALFLYYHLFADDTQLYQLFNHNSADSQELVRTCIETAIHRINSWMNANKLKLDETKTEFMILGTKQQIKKLSFNNMPISNETIEAKPSVRNPLERGWTPSSK